jgi:cytochrome c553
MVTMRILGWLLLAGATMAQAPVTETPAPKPIGTIAELMDHLIYPTSDAIFYVASRAPNNDVEWNELQAKTLILAEAANLLMMPGRARDQDGWMKDAKLLQDAGTAAFRAAKARDLAKLSAMNDQMYAACVACHNDYRPNYRRRPLTPEKVPE